MIIKAKDFILRYPKAADAKENFLYQQDKEAKRNFRSVPQTLEESRAEIKEDIKENKKKDKTKESFVIEIQGKFAGMVKLKTIVKGHKCQISYFLGSPFRGRGVVSKAVKLVLKHGIKKYKLVRIEAGARGFNKASHRVLEKNGFTLEGIRKKATKIGNRFYDDVSYAKVR